MHPNNLVYNPATMVRLNNAGSYNRIGCNFDPSHLWWQGMDRIAALQHISNIVWHVHAKDMRETDISLIHGNLDNSTMSDPGNRAWNFCTVGYGHGMDFWAKFLASLRMWGYDGAISIEHEDALMSGLEGLGKALDALNPLIIREPADVPFWSGD
jgi:sugar phosphate isomerase/epimerase